MVPMWHDSEVAAIAFAVQNILARRVAEPQQQVLPLDEPGSARWHAARHGRQEVHRMRRARRDPQGRLRLLHAVRPPG
jgi:hypothetical protein